MLKFLLAQMNRIRSFVKRCIAVGLAVCMLIGGSTPAFGLYVDELPLTAEIISEALEEIEEGEDAEATGEESETALGANIDADESEDAEAGDAEAGDARDLDVEDAGEDKAVEAGELDCEEAAESEEVIEDDEADDEVTSGTAIEIDTSGVAIAKGPAKSAPLRAAASAPSTPSLSGDDFRAWAQVGNVTITPASGNATNISINGTEAEPNALSLIMLSNTDPEFYQSAEISVAASFQIDLTASEEVSFTPAATASDPALETITQSYVYLGLGSAEHPFEGRLHQFANSELLLKLNRSLFNVLSDKSNRGGAAAGKIVLSGTTESPIFAERIAHESGESSEYLWTVDIASGTASGGFIGTMTESSRIALKLGFLGAYTVAGGRAGVVCNTMEAAAVLRFPEGLSLQADISVTGSLEAGAIAGYASDPSVVTGEGDLSEAAVFTKTDNQSISLGSITLKSTGAAGCGGLFGKLDVSEKSIMRTDSGTYNFLGSYNEATAAVSNTIIIQNTNGNGFVGGLLGRLYINREDFTIGSDRILAEYHGDNNISKTGGVVGRVTGELQGSALPMLIIDGINLAYKSENDAGRMGSGFFGGLVCELGDGSTGVYLNAHNCSVVTKTPWSNSNKVHYGGAASVICESSVLRLDSFAYSSGNDVWINGAGLVAYIKDGGALCLSGTIDLSKALYHKDTASGQLVGVQGDSLVYAERGTILLRGAGKLQNSVDSNAKVVSDIGNYGSVVRLEGDLSEDLITISAITNKIEITNAWNAGAGGTGTNITLGSADEYAALSIAIQSHGKFVKNPGDSVIGLEKKTIILTGDIDLTGTGLGMLSRDIDEADANAKYRFTDGTFNGAGYKLTLAIGENWGIIGNTSYLAADGRLVNSRQEKGNFNASSHTHVAMFSYCENVTVQNLTIAGCVRAAGIDKAQRGDFAAFAATVYGTLNCIGVELETEIDYIAALQDGNKKYAHVGGFVGLLYPDSELNFTNCGTSSGAIINTARDQGQGSVAAGMLAGYSNESSTINVTGGSYGGSISSGGIDMYCGGLAGNIEGSSNAICRVNLNGVSFDSMQISGTGFNTGGLLGHTWKHTEVSFAGGITVTNSSISSNSATGGLCYAATGYWNVPENGINLQSLSVNTGNGTLGLLVNQGVIGNDALYLELSHANSYLIKTSGVSIRKNSNTSFDEIVYNTATSRGIFANGCAVISIATEGEARIDIGGTRNTYINRTINSQTGAAWAGNNSSRYYYNIHKYRAAATNGAEALLVWSLYHYSAANLSSKFPVPVLGTNDCETMFWKDRIGFHVTGQAEDATEINLSGYSYYPINAPANVTINPGVTIVFDNASIESMEATEAATGTRKPSESNQHAMMHSGLFYNVSSAVTIASEADPLVLSGSIGRYDDKSGAFVCNSYVAGSSSFSKATYTLENITLKNLYIAGYTGGAAALLVNSVGGYTNLTVRNITTGSETDSDIYRANTGEGFWYAAGSLIGTVGSADAKGITLIFDNMRLDARKRENAGALVFGSYSSIFSRASFLERFSYDNESSGTYNFNLEEDWSGSTHVQNVTYGLEISDSNRNPEEQCWYYQSNYYVNAGMAPDSSTQGDFSGYKPYVYSGEDGLTKTHEIDVNLILYHLINGCGTFSDPYILQNAGELQALASYLYQDGAHPHEEWQVNYPDGGHNCISKAAHKTYTYNTSLEWVPSSGSNISNEVMFDHLRTAYYSIEPSGGNVISLRRQFTGLGTENKPFSGIIIGNDTTLIVKNPDGSGLVRYSGGCVVKDLSLTVDPVSGTISLGTDKVMGPAIGEILAGDSVIDNVVVSFASGTHIGAGTPAYAAIGGMVGRISGGGLILRNITATPNVPSFSSNYCNPFVGRVLDGYAVSEDCAVDNTDKNYKIPELFEETGTFVFNGETAELSSAQAVFLMSSLINSGCVSGGCGFRHRGLIDYSAVGTPTPDTDADSDIPYLHAAYSNDRYWNNSIVLTGSGEIDMSSYGTGFRGFGRRYGNNGLRVDSFNGNGRSIRLGMKVEDVSGGALAGSIGLFNQLQSASIANLTVSGNITCAAVGSPRVGALVGTISSGSNTITNCIMQASVSGGSNAGGMIAYLEDGCNISINNCEIRDIKVNPNSGGAGGIIGFQKGGSASISGVSVTGINVYGGTNAGGILGTQEYKGSLTVDGCTVSAIKVGFNGSSGSPSYSSSSETNSGGIVGLAEKTVTVSNTVCKDSIIVAKKSEGQVAALVGQGLNSACIISLYDVQSINNQMWGQDQGVVTGKLWGKASAKIDGLYVKDNYFPGNTVNSNSNWYKGGYGILTGSAGDIVVDGCNILIDWAQDSGYPYKEAPAVWIGWAQGNSELRLVGVSVVGENIPAREYYNAGISEAESYIIYADHDGSGEPEAFGPSVTTSPIGSVTIGAAALYGDAVVLGQALNIYNNANTNPAALGTTDLRSGYSANLKTGLDAEYFTSFNARKGGVLAADFPVLLVNKNKPADIDALIQAYLKLMTNGGWTKAKNISGVNVDIKSYLWEDSSFSEITEPEKTLSYNSVTKSFVSSSTTDGEGNRFTLITITIPNPCGGAAYKLYVPVIVERPVQIFFNADLVPGSEFRDDLFNPLTDIIVSEHGKKFTLRLEYFYDYSWGELFNNRMDWSYEKLLNISEGTGNRLPAGTKLTLVDVQSGDLPITAVLGSNADEINISELLLSGAASHDMSEIAYMDTVCDSDFGERWREAGPSEASDITLGGVDYKKDPAGSLILRCKELYFLVIETPATETAFVQLEFTSPATLDGANSDTGLSNTVTQSASDLLTLYRSLELQLARSNDSLNGHSVNGNTEIARSDNTITLCLDATVVGPQQIIGPTTHRYLQFDVRLRGFEEEAGSHQPFPATQVQASFYRVDGENEIPLVDSSRSLLLAAGSNELRLPLLGDGDAPVDITEYMTLSGDSKTVTIRAYIQMMIQEEDIAGAFPAASLQGSAPDAYTRIDATVSLSEDANLISGKVSEKLDGNAYYYRAQNQDAALVFSANDKAQLGINPASPEEAPDGSTLIEASGLISFIAPEAQLQECGTMTCTLELLKKSGIGYASISDDAVYIRPGTMKLNNVVSNASNHLWTWTIPKGDGSYSGMYDELSGTILIPVSLEVMRNISSYANYKLELTVSFDDAAGMHTNVLMLSDHIIYNYSRIPTYFMPEHN